MELGFALGLFAVFGILRYRTEPIRILDLTYLFIVIGLGILNAAANKKSASPRSSPSTRPSCSRPRSSSSAASRSQRSTPMHYDKLELLRPGNESAPRRSRRADRARGRARPCASYRHDSRRRRDRGPPYRAEAVGIERWRAGIRGRWLSSQCLEGNDRVPGTHDHVATSAIMRLWLSTVPVAAAAGAGVLVGRCASPPARRQVFSVQRALGGDGRAGRHRARSAAAVVVGGATRGDADVPSVLA